MKSYVRFVNFLMGVAMLASAAADASVASRGASLVFFYVPAVLMFLFSIGPIMTAFRDAPQTPPSE